MTRACGGAKELILSPSMTAEAISFRVMQGADGQWAVSKQGK